MVLKQQVTARGVDQNGKRAMGIYSLFAPSPESVHNGSESRERRAKRGKPDCGMRQRQMR